MSKHIHCPANAWGCPYFNDNGTCAMVEEDLDPMQECDDFALFYEEGDDYYCDEEH